jgi:hypothetical protein
LLLARLSRVYHGGTPCTSRGPIQQRSAQQFLAAGRARLLAQIEQGDFEALPRRGAKRSGSFCTLLARNSRNMLAPLRQVTLEILRRGGLAAGMNPVVGGLRQFAFFAEA